jgi:ubiquinone/menaquinone biosynthesis C-methylase UbiE
MIPVSNHLILATILALLGGAFLAYNLPTSLKGLGRAIVIATAVLLAVFLIGGLGLTRFIRRQRAIVRRMVIDSIPWQGTESVLDVGCGTGMLLNGCAQRLTTGKAIGIDLWQEPVAGTPNVLMENARAEGVADKVDYQEMDARHLTFEDSRFNVVVSSLALHHIGTQPEDREQAVTQMIRVLAPGGYLSLVDVSSMIDIAESVIARSGLQITRREQARFFRLLTARKA